MASVPITELKARLSKYVRMAERGVEVQVLDRGVPVARLVAMSSSGQSEEAGVDRLVRAGTVKKGSGRVRALVRRRVAASADLGRALDEERRDRL
jgi:prevent-host-death family protein